MDEYNIDNEKVLNAITEFLNRNEFNLNNFELISFSGAIYSIINNRISTDRMLDKIKLNRMKMFEDIDKEKIN